jgi:predicted XRE-type DNA-binding protein
MPTKPARPRPVAEAESPKRRAVHAARIAPVAAAQGEEVAVTASSGNVFDDLGLPDAAGRLAKAVLSRIIQERVAELGWTQRAAATSLNIAASDMSDLMRGKLARFSQERLERFLNALDLDVVIHVGPRPAWKDRAGVTVMRVGRFSR